MITVTVYRISDGHFFNKFKVSTVPRKEEMITFKTERGEWISCKVLEVEHILTTDLVRIKIHH